MGHTVDALTGLMQGAKYLASPHCDARPTGVEIDLLVIHGISLPPGEFGGPWIEQLFLGTLQQGDHPYFATITSLKVSSHMVIRRDGALLQFVPFHKRAWHAGASSFQGRKACNDFSIGIELEGADDMAYTPEQYTRLTAVTVGLMRGHPGITLAHVVGHSDVAPGRKTDPGPAFDWVRYRTYLQASPGTG